MKKKIFREKRQLGKVKEEITSKKATKSKSNSLKTVKNKNAPKKKETNND